MTPKRRVDDAGHPIRDVPDEGFIFARQTEIASMVREERRQAPMRRVSFRDHDQARRILIQAIDNSSAANSADTRKRRPAMCDQRIDQRAALVAGRRMDDEPSRSVDDDEMRVFENHGEWNGLRLGAAGIAGGTVSSIV